MRGLAAEVMVVRGWMAQATAMQGLASEVPVVRG